MTIPDKTEHFHDENHALKVGMLLGLLMKAGIPAVPLADEDGNFTSGIQIRFALAPHEPITVEVMVLP